MEKNILQVSFKTYITKGTKRRNIRLHHLFQRFTKKQPKDGGGGGNDKVQEKH